MVENIKNVLHSYHRSEGDKESLKISSQTSFPVLRYFGRRVTKTGFEKNAFEIKR